mmetsp:Transcript_1259/g.907  ORF Transcript_1259/g.907 Transcript_1259/m.907 type:complete len:102 (+) Transcript_1259:2106-2411(+)
MLPDASPTDIADNLWLIYEQYTFNFELALLRITDATEYSIKSYGVLNSAYLGFSTEEKLMIYIRDSYDNEVSEDNPIVVGAGQKSDNTYHLYSPDRVVCDI